MELDPKALSDDGYIIDQRQTESISFGGCPPSFLRAITSPSPLVPGMYPPY